ncbi:c-type cytochrome [Aurantiacibacter suaedae]|uniref:c-type cytochrome n=1 Tax=Aurantiacibacter suaedae TaxID=2545755 RepID=UPI0010F515D3|nr:cytochrome c [Aurantiacibacter suaedae]
MSNSALKSAFLALPLIFGGCQTVPVDQVEAAPPIVSSDGHALAQAACAGCHSVERYGLSPNPKSPEFPTIANARGLSVATLTNWLRSAHNYPEEMDFYLEDDETASLVSYIFTLRDEAYQPPR